MALDVFISHSRGSTPEATRLAAALRARGFSTWVDGENLTHGENWRDTLKGALEASQAIVVLIEPGPEPSRQLRDEWSEALEAAWDQPRKRLIPLLLPDAELPPFLQDRHALRVEHGQEDWERAVGDLAHALRDETDPLGETDPSAFDEASSAWRRRLREIETAANELKRSE